MSVWEHDIHKREDFRNLGIRLSAPKTNLLRGERTTLEVLVSGLAGVTQDVPLGLENRSSEIIGMEGGEQQRVMIHPSDVREGGLYRAQRGLTGVQPGAFIINGTVSWSERNTFSQRTDEPGGVVAGGSGPVSQPTPTPLVPTDTASGQVCKWVDYKTYRVDEFKTEDSTDKNPEVRHASAKGGGVTVSFHCKAAGTFIFKVTKESASPDVVSVTCTQP